MITFLHYPDLLNSSLIVMALIRRSGDATSSAQTLRCVQYIRSVFYFTPRFYSVTLGMPLHSSFFFVVTVFWYFSNDGKYVGTFSSVIVVCIALIGYGAVFGNHLNYETLIFKFVELN